MEFLFFDSSGKPMFTRNDAEQAEHTHEELSLYVLFPYDPNKVITHGMRVCYLDATGVYVAFEIRKVKNYEPDHYQEITAENIVVSELSDEVIQETEIEGATARSALSALLNGTGWSIGTADGGTEEKDYTVSLGFVWPAVREIEKHWEVHITPRVTIASTGITGKYLDITPFEGTFRGLRLSLEKNMQDSAVTWDDTKVKTAAYGYGKETEGGVPLTFADVVWTATDDHPAKPSGQTYIMDPTAAAEYNRNGRPRFTVLQSAEQDNAEELLQETWDYLKPLTTPDVSVEGTVSDLVRLGVPADIPIKLHDMALAQITPTGTILQKQVIRYMENLLDPLDGHITIGDYIPDMVSISVALGHQLDGLKSYIDLTASHLRIQFEDELNSLRSYVELTASLLRIEFEDGLNSLRSYVELTASHLRLEFEDGLNSLRSYVELTASHLRLEFEDGLNSLRSYVELTASHLTLEFEDGLNSLRSYVELTASHLTIEFTDEINSLRSYVELTASHLEVQFTDEVNSLRSYVDIQAGLIAMNVAATDENSSILRQAGMYINDLGVLVYATDNQNNIGSKFNVLSNEISAKVGKSEVVITADSITIGSDTLSLEGYVTATYLTANYLTATQAEAKFLTSDSLDAALLNGKNIIAGSLTSGSITVNGAAGFYGGIITNGIAVDGQPFATHAHTFTASESGGQITLTLGGATSANQSVNFNIAATKVYKDGVAAARTAGYNEARTDWRPDNITISGKTVTVINAAGDDVGGPYSAAQIYDDGYAAGQAAGSYAAGWAAAKAAISISENQISGPSSTVDSTEVLYTITADAIATLRQSDPTTYQARAVAHADVNGTTVATATDYDP